MRTEETESWPEEKVSLSEEKGHQRARRRGRVTVFDNWCKGCGLCVAFCPQHVFDSKADGHIVVAHEERCTACLWCYEHCPDFAIVVEVLDAEEVSPERMGEGRA